MNILEKQAVDFIEKLAVKNDDYRTFINTLNEKTATYKENNHKAVFLERVLLIIKTNQKKHLNHCREHANNACRFSKSNEIIMTFLQNEIDLYKKEVSLPCFKKNDKHFLTVEHMIALQENLRIKDEQKMVKFRSELQEMEVYDFLDKKNWKQLFKGKVVDLFEMGVLTQQSARKLVHKIELIY